jgi:hypothetical protein
METNAQAHVKSVELEVTIVRADGTVEELGSVAYWHKNPLRRLFHRLRHKDVGKISCRSA